MRSVNGFSVRLAAICVLVTAMAGAVLASDADMAQVMPGNSLLYVGWAGSEHNAAAMKGTALGKMLEELIS